MCALLLDLANSHGSGPIQGEFENHAVRIGHVHGAAIAMLEHIHLRLDIPRRPQPLLDTGLSFVIDIQGNVTGAVIVTPDGQTRTYAAGKLVDLRQADQSEILYASDKPLKLITPEKISYNFDYTNPAIIQAVIDPSITNAK